MENHKESFCCLLDSNHINAIYHCSCCHETLNGKRGNLKLIHSPPPLKLDPLEKTLPPSLTLDSKYKSNMIRIGELKLDVEPFFVGRCGFKMQLNNINTFLKKRRFLCHTVCHDRPHRQEIRICPYAHTFKEIKVCTKECTHVKLVVDESKNCVGVGNMDALYITNQGRCTMRHPGESLESYILRNKIVVKNLEKLITRKAESGKTLEEITVRVNDDKDVIKYVLESAKEIKMKKVTLTRKMLF